MVKLRTILKYNTKIFYIIKEIKLSLEIFYFPIQQTADREQ